MRKLTDKDLANIAGLTIQGFRVEGVRVKRGQYLDSDHYGIILGRNDRGRFATWQFHLDEDDKPCIYWGNYFLENHEAALRDFDTRDLGTKPFRVTITETLKLVVDVEAKDRHDAEQLVSDNWRKSEYVLTAENFAGVEFRAVAGDVEFRAADGEAAKDELSIIWDKYLQYLCDWASSHDGPEFYGMTPACFDEWFSCEYPEDEDCE